ncbi:MULTISPECIES: DUF2946 family protein [unclassified Herbaspirillum]|uniref:DUF2946 family protein n=1 Tax=unclassified Herbaspirillum TaxID=2624150 RepID=UPI0011517EA9|nr:MULTISPECIES: DUF2946 family protein [unclassified Herbaspirillum]MBB5393226.1 hypothetical protein [Herbaspirillum sp. SJZ102]
MQMSLPKLRLIAWITIASILAMLWSGTMHARAGAAPGMQAWIDICSVSGAAALADQGSPGKNDANAHVTHCAFCSKQDIAHAIPARFDLPQPSARPLRVQSPSSFTHRSPPPWLSRHSRGPPASMS